MTLRSAVLLKHHLAVNNMWQCHKVISRRKFENVHDVDLIRHAYVLSGLQGRGVGSALINHLKHVATRPLLVGTWEDAAWAIRFYERHGFELVSAVEKDQLARKYWSIPQRQIDTSVVLVDRGYRTYNPQNEI